uniref:Uncharacterized protein n=1 Tax=Trypanosoma vivax (strain Y486) TaxID=1055687 RepID=G0UCU1_TRYVY|nr:hypothetical protein TVY486_1111350 [Trypanosoma vivax Y486]
MAVGEPVLLPTAIRHPNWLFYENCLPCHAFVRLFALQVLCSSLILLLLLLIILFLFVHQPFPPISNWYTDHIFRPSPHPHPAVITNCCLFSRSFHTSTHKTEFTPLTRPLSSEKVHLLPFSSLLIAYIVLEVGFSQRH